MKLSIQSPREFINPLLSKKKIDSKSYTQFTEHLSHLLKVDQSETEEHQKNAVRDFLNEAFNYKMVNSSTKCNAVKKTCRRNKPMPFTRSVV